MPTDAELLRVYVESDSQDAFAALVRRHLPFTYSAALRQVGGDPHRAQEVVQRVFILLARKARSLSKHPALIGWLCTTTYYTAAKLRRAEQRRAHAEAGTVNEDGPTNLSWDHLGPVVDDLLLKLKERNRRAVLLRFFSDQTYKEIGEQLGLTENAARMRVDRALELLRAALEKRGIASSSAALGALLTTHAIAAVPEGLFAAVSASVLSATAVGSGVFIFMASTLVKVGVAVVVLATGSAGFILHQRSVDENQRLGEELRVTKRQLARIHAQQSELPQTASLNSEAVPVNPIHSTTSSGLQAPESAPVDLRTAFTRLKDMRDVGRATPAEAVQTVCWAIENGDEKLSEMLFLNKAARATVLEMMEVLSPAQREAYDTPEKVAALYLSRYVLAQINTLKIDRVSELDVETAEVRLLSAEKNGPTVISMQRGADGWLWKVKPSLMEYAKKELLGTQTQPAAIARKP